MAKAKAVTGAKQQKPVTPTTCTVRVVRMNVIKDPVKVHAWADVLIAECFVVDGLSVRKNDAGELYVLMPRVQGKDGKWYDRAHPITREMRNLTEDVVLKEYTTKTAVVAVPVA